MDDQEYLFLKRGILKLTSINLDHYKNQQMRRRLDRFFAHTEAKNVVDYVRMLGCDQDMLDKLRDFITINVSEFFRDSSPFQQLRTSVLPRLLKKTSKLNIWSAGCSHGEEPYSIAMMLESIFPYHHHRILATDIDMNVLKQAMAGGPYSSSDIKNVSPILLQKYLTCANGNYMISDRVKRRVEFRQHNLLCDEFERGFDLIVCRNVTIYFTEEAKKELNRKFYHSLRDGGVLFIGGTEVILDVVATGFTVLETSFYQKPVPSVSRKILAREALPLKI